MCRWLAYSGSPIRLEELLLKPGHSLIDQSLHARLGATTTNGDGFGIGWYDDEDDPGIFNSVEPAWNNSNLVELSRHLSSPLVFAHIRASTGTAIQRTNCHPFRHGRWLWMHNGQIREFSKLKRDLAFAVDPTLFSGIEGSTDSELFFYLALSMGLKDDPPLAVARAVGLIEATGQEHGVENPLQMTVATTDGDTVWAFRHSSDKKSGTLFFSTEVEKLRQRYPDHPLASALSKDTRLIVSEPLGDLAGVWNPVPESSCCTLHAGECDRSPFEPQHP